MNEETQRELIFKINNRLGDYLHYSIQMERKKNEIYDLMLNFDLGEQKTGMLLLKALTDTLKNKDVIFNEDCIYWIDDWIERRNIKMKELNNKYK